ncbi:MULTISPECIES: hypothetical protein [Flavobacterium]|uniref:hypothetical protein n=1 Tax=Flavobacterium TaxID=237 RepID=UPI002115AFAA|nr:MULTISPECIES: hypothetical protein [Flavobacterium]UUF15229.1 hypothetical protein NLJ00_03785 [Flavobacterium panici]
MSYSKRIAVLSLRRGIKPQRDVIIGVADSAIINSSYLSDFNLSSINKIVIKLEELVRSDGGGFIWGQEYIMIDSSPEISFCENDLDKETLPDVPTISLLKLMIEIQKIKTEYQNPDNLKKIIGQVFAIIKSDPDNHRRWTESDTDFAVTINDVYIVLVLVSEDFDLTVEEYVSQLQTTFY